MAPLGAMTVALGLMLSAGAMSTVRFWDSKLACDSTAVPDCRASASPVWRLIRIKLGVNEIQLAMSGVVWVRN